MDRETLEARKASIEQRFTELSKEKSDIEVELNRLQGDYRTVVDLIENLPQETESPESDGDSSIEEPATDENIAPNGDDLNLTDEEKESEDAPNPS